MQGNWRGGRELRSGIEQMISQAVGHRYLIAYVVNTFVVDVINCIQSGSNSFVRQFEMNKAIARLYIFLLTMTFNLTLLKNLFFHYLIHD